MSIKSTGLPTPRIVFQFFAETKGALRYQEVVEPGASAAIGTLYVRKDTFARFSATWASDGAAPTRIVVTLEEAES
jgi:hypothetical protein